MQRLALAAAALGMAAIAAFLSARSAPGDAPAAGNTPIQIRVESINPWTSLKLNNEPRNFQFAIITDRTGDIAQASSPRPLKKSI